MENSVAITVTPSLLHNNLSSSDQRLAYVTNATTPNPQIHLMSFQSIAIPDASGFSTVKYNDSNTILYMSYVKLGQKYFLLIGLEQNMQIWSEDGNSMLAYFNKGELSGAGADTYFTGGYGCDELNCILIGSSLGTITLMRVSEEGYTIKIDPQSTISPVRRAPISAIVSLGIKALSCDELGGVTFWDLRANNTIRCLENEGSGVSGTSACMVYRYACVAFGNGEIRIYDMNTHTIAFSVWSHTRWITGLVSYPERGIFASCAEDCCVNVWTLQRDELELVLSKEIPNTLLTGISMCRDKLVAVGYDKARLFIIETLT